MYTIYCKKNVTSPVPFSGIDKYSESAQNNTKFQQTIFILIISFHSAQLDLRFHNSRGGN